MKRLTLLSGSVLAVIAAFFCGWAFGFWDWGRDCVPVGPREADWRSWEPVHSA